MKKLIIAAAFSLGIISASNAQSRGDHKERTPEERAKMMAGGLQKKLDLTNDQEQKVYQTFLARADKMKDHKQDGNFDRTKMKAENEAFEKNLQSIFTDAQKQKYNEMKSQMHDRAKRGGHHKGGKDENKEG